MTIITKVLSWQNVRNGKIKIIPWLNVLNSIRRGLRWKLKDHIQEGKVSDTKRSKDKFYIIKKKKVFSKKKLIEKLKAREYSAFHDGETYGQ